MSKIKVKNYPYLLPKPVVILGAIVGEYPNYMTIADVCTTGYLKPRFVISSGKNHYTNQGIIENKSFSVNIPKESMVAVTDFCGINSGKKVDKNNLFKHFYSENVPKAPLIEEAPINFACRLVKTVDFGDTHYIFIGEIIDTYVNDHYITNNIPEMKKIQPFSYYGNKYWSVGEPIADAYRIGKTYERS